MLRLSRSLFGCVHVQKLSNPDFIGVLAGSGNDKLKLWKYFCYDLFTIACLYMRTPMGDTKANKQF